MPKWPGRGAGSYPYVGRTFDTESRTNRADDVPAEVTLYVPGTTTLTVEARRLAHELCKRDGDLLPADAETAKFCSVPFVALERGADGEWGPRSAPVKSSKGGE